MGNSGGKWYRHGETVEPGENLSHSHFAPYRSHMDWPGIVNVENTAIEELVL